MFPELLKVFAIIAMFMLHCSVLGWALLPSTLGAGPLGSDSNVYLKWFFALCLGILANIALLFVLGITGNLTAPAVLVTGLLALLGSTPWIISHLRAGSFHTVRDTETPYIAAALALMFFLSVVVAFHPPGHWDDTMYHLPLARHYVQHQEIVLAKYLRFPLFPQNINLLFVLGLMFGDVILAQAFSSLPLFVMGIGLIGVSITIVKSAHIGILAAAALFMIGPIKRTIGYAYIDNGLGMFCWAATIAVLFWSSEMNAKSARYWLILAGLMAGAAAGSKYFGLVLAGLLSVYLLLVRRNWKATFVYGLALLAAGSWWYIRSFAIAGDPVHPAGGSLFGYYLWDAQDLQLQASEQATYGTSRNPLYVWAALKAAHVPVWALAILGLLLAKVPKSIRVLQLVFVAYFAFWFFVTQVWRYLAPIYAVATFLSCYTLYRCLAWASARVPVRHTLKASTWPVILLTALLAVYTTNRLYAYHEKMANWETTLASETGYRLFQLANSHIPQFGPKLVQLGFEKDVYFFNGTVIGDWFGPGRYRDLLKCANEKCHPLSPQAMHQYMDRVGAQMLAVSIKEYPGFNAVDYEKEFTVLAELPDGVLLKKRR